jgi:uncharacterized Fe-S center protein
MAITKAGHLAVDQHSFDLGRKFENITIGDDKVGSLADLDRTDQFVDAEDLCGIKGDTLQCFLTG